MQYEPDPALVDILAKRQPRIIPGEPQAYKRAVIRMVLCHVQNQREALDELAALDESMGARNEAGA